MIKETLLKIESAIARIQAADGKEKAELVALLRKLKDELADLPESSLDDARSIAHFTETAAHEVTRSNKSLERSNLSISGMAYSVKGFEASHPALVELTNEICMMLARMGI
ncbi:MAG: DUF4404 family protein [Elusimicrobiales bacterium]